MAGRLQRILGFGFGLAVIVGATLGIGILRSPGLVAGQLGTRTAILAIWIVGGIYTLVSASCFIELGAMLPQAGGYYVYARRAFGDTVGFAVGWTDWLTYCAVLGYLSIGIAEFTATLAPALSGAVTPIAVTALFGFVALQWAGLKVSSRFQEIATALKFCAFLVLVGACFAFAPARTASEVPGAATTFTGIIVALQLVTVTYGGWQSALYFAEEDRDPVRNLPRSMIGGVVAVIVVYMLVNLALLAVLPVADLASSTLPAADAARAIFGERGGTVVTILSLISLPAALNAIMMIATRILFAMGRDGLFWRRTAEVNAGGTPGVATLVSTAVAIVLIGTGTFQRLVAMASFFLAVNYCVCCVALFVFRWREPGLPRPLKAWGYPWTAALVLAAAAAFVAGVVAGDPATAVTALALLAAGLAGWLVQKRLRAVE